MRWPNVNPVNPTLNPNFRRFLPYYLSGARSFSLALSIEFFLFAQIRSSVLIRHLTPLSQTIPVK